MRLSTFSALRRDLEQVQPKRYEVKMLRPKNISSTWHYNQKVDG
jgi:hypothetical protein